MRGKQKMRIKMRLYLQIAIIQQQQQKIKMLEAVFQQTANCKDCSAICACRNWVVAAALDEQKSAFPRLHAPSLRDLETSNLLFVYRKSRLQPRIVVIAVDLGTRKCL